MDSLYEWLVYAHIAGAFVFVLGHGASTAAALQLRRERSLERVRALLDASNSSLTLTYIGLLVLLASGVAAGFLGDYWGRGWIWTALVLLIAIIVLMYVLGSAYYAEVRTAAGMQTYATRKQPAPPPRPEAELAALLAKPRALELFWIGAIGFLAILFLMRFKPF